MENDLVPTTQWGWKGRGFGLDEKLVHFGEMGWKRGGTKNVKGEDKGLSPARETNEADRRLCSPTGPRVNVIESVDGRAWNYARRG